MQVAFSLCWHILPSSHLITILSSFQSNHHLLFSWHVLCWSYWAWRLPGIENLLSAKQPVSHLEALIFRKLILSWNRLLVTISPLAHLYPFREQLASPFCFSSTCDTCIRAPFLQSFLTWHGFDTQHFPYPRPAEIVHLVFAPPEMWAPVPASWVSKCGLPAV